MSLRSEDLLTIEEVRRKAESGEARAIRRAAGLSMHDVAVVCGVVASTVARWESGDHLPRSRAALKYARVLARIQARLVERQEAVG